MSIHHHELQHDNPVLHHVIKDVEDRKFFHVVIAGEDNHVDILYADTGEVLQTTLNYKAADGRHLVTGGGGTMDLVQEVLLGS